MTAMEDDYPPPTHLDAIREAWWEFREGTAIRAYGYASKLPRPIAWLCAPWRPLIYRFSPLNLEKLFRPLKAERRQRLDDLNQCAFICGGSQLSEESWAEVPALLAEFGGVFPPRDWEPMTVCETVGAIMGYSRDEVAEITGVSNAPGTS